MPLVGIVQQMQNKLLATLSVFALATVAHAQTSNTMPVGLDTTEGNAVFFHWGASRYLSGIGPLAGPRVINQLAFRRDGSPSGVARTMDVDVTLSTGNLNFVVSDHNLIHGANKSIVLSQTGVNFPDWSTAAGSPAPFDFVLKFQRPFPYTAGALAWTVFYQNSTSTGSATTDREYTGPTNGSSSIVGTGCANFLHAMQLENNGPAMPNNGMRIRVSVSGAQPAVPAWLMIDFTASNIPIPGLCANLYAVPTIFQYLTMTSATGTTPLVYMGFPYIPGAQGATIVTQILALDPTNTAFPLAVSNGRQATMPTSTSTASKEATYIWSTAPTTTGTAFFGGSLVVELK